MIHLDTNYIIGLVTKGSPLRHELEKWLRGGEVIAASAIAWSEFITRPVTAEQIQDASAMLEQRIVPFGAVEAVLAARIFNRAGRKRSTRVDSFIGATAIASSAWFATQNRKDFLPFVTSGLRLA